jgi:putative transport protein
MFLSLNYSIIYLFIQISAAVPAVSGDELIKLNPVLLVGAMTGAGTCTAAMNSVKEDARSAIPVIGYTVPYVIGNVLLTV